MDRDVEVEATRTTEVEAVTTALEQVREDQAMGAAWRRCEAALPEDDRLQLDGRPGAWSVSDWQILEPPFSVGGTVYSVRLDAHGPTPTAALEALAEALEARAAEMTDSGAAAEEATWD